MSGNVGQRLQHFRSVRKHLEGAGRVLIVGGGAVGIELAGEITETFPEKRVTVVEAGPRILPLTSEKPRRWAAEFLQRPRCRDPHWRAYRSARIDTAGKSRCARGAGRDRQRHPHRLRRRPLVRWLETGRVVPAAALSRSARSARIDQGLRGHADDRTAAHLRRRRHHRPARKGRFVGAVPCQGCDQEFATADRRAGDAQAVRVTSVRCRARRCS